MNSPATLPATPLHEAIAARLAHIPQLKTLGDLIYLKLLEGKHIGSFQGYNTDRDLQASTLAKSVGYKDRRRRAEEKARAQFQGVIKRTWGEMMKEVIAWHHDHEKKGVGAGGLQERLKKLLKLHYEQAFMAGLRAAALPSKPEKKSFGLTAEEKRWVQSAYVHELKFFNKLLKEMVAGTHRGALSKRLMNYLETSKAIFEAGRMQGVGGNTLIFWELHPAEHCEDCLKLSKLSPFTKFYLPTTPKAGSTACLMNCKCTLRLKKVSAKVYTQTSQKNLRQLKTLKLTRGKVTNRV